MQLTEEMLQTAMKKAIEHGLLPRKQTEDLYSQNLAMMKDILQATLTKLGRQADISFSETDAASSQPVRAHYPHFRTGRRVTYIPGVIGKQQ